MKKISGEHLWKTREDLQEYISSIESMLRRWIYGKLRAAGWYDVDDIFASMRRRLDLRLLKGELTIRSEGQLNCLIRKVAQRVAFEKYRKCRRQQHLEQIAARVRAQVQSQNAVEPDDVNFCHFIDIRGCDRRLLDLWMEGLSEYEIASVLGITFEAYRKRRQRLFSRVRSKISARCKVHQPLL